MASPQTSDALASLQTAIASTSALINNLTPAVQAPLTLNPTSPNALALLTTASTLLRAQTTKLSLLVLNKPFTPSAITTVLRTIASSIIPALVSSAQLCPADIYSHTIAQGVRAGVSALLKELLNLLSEIPVDEHGVEHTRGRDTLASTGVIWEGCDAMIKLGTDGIAGAAAAKVEGWKGLLGDAIEELEEWSTGDSDGVLGDEMADLNVSDKKSSTPADDGDPTDLFTAPDDPSAAIRPLAASSIATLRLLHLLYAPLVKRRIRRFPNVTAATRQGEFTDSETVAVLDRLVERCRVFSEEADEIAGELYAGERDEVKWRLERLRAMGRECVEDVRAKWEGGDDEFSGWVGKWLVKLDELS